MSEFNIKVGDRLPVVAATLLDADGEPVDLTTASGVEFRMRRHLSADPALEAACIITAPTDGEVEYRWAADETTTAGAGVYDAEFVVTWNDGRIQTVPNRGTFRVRIAATLE